MDLWHLINCSYYSQHAVRLIKAKASHHTVDSGHCSRERSGALPQHCITALQHLTGASSQAAASGAPAGATSLHTSTVADLQQTRQPVRSGLRADVASLFLSHDRSSRFHAESDACSQSLSARPKSSSSSLFSSSMRSAGFSPQSFSSSGSTPSERR